MTSPWFSYDSAATIYGAVSVPLMFQKPAADLVGLLLPARNQSFLDVGAGTGAISVEARSRGSAVTALDLSPAMLRQTKGISIVAGRVPGLPFPNDCFDFIASGFVLTHIADYRSALEDMKRVLAPSGKIGFAFWKVLQNNYSEAWSEIAQAFAGKDFFSDAATEVLPWEDWFSESQNVASALNSAGFSSVRIEEKDYQCSSTIQEYLASRKISLQGRFLQNQWEEAKWLHFLDSVEEEFRFRFQDPLKFTTSVIFGIGQKRVLW
jgi:ubiquinone/menaquinone biosynthesis C-methylase UbiE